MAIDENGDVYQDDVRCDKCHSWFLECVETDSATLCIKCCHCGFDCWDYYQERLAELEPYPTFTDRYEVDPKSKEKVEVLLSSWEGSPVTLNSESIWGFAFESTVVEVKLLPKNTGSDDQESLKIFGFALVQAPYDEEIYCCLMTEADTPYVKWQIARKENEMTVTCVIQMPMLAITEDNLNFALTTVAECADSWGEILKERFGGKLYIDLRG